MSYAALITCDGCGKVRGPANHWFSAAQVQHGDDQVLIFTPYIEASAIHLCGQECAHKLLSAYLGGES